MASFAGLTIKDAIDLANLDDSRLSRLDDDHRGRLLAVRSDLVAALRRRAPLAEQDEPGDEPEPKPLPGYEDTSEADFEYDEKTGRLVKKKKKARAEDDEAESESDDVVKPDHDPGKPDQSPDPDRRDPSATAWPAIPANAKTLALRVVNAGRVRRGLAPITALIQDQALVSVDTMPRTIEGFARAIIACGRKARGLPQLKASEFITIRQLRGEK